MRRLLLLLTGVVVFAAWAPPAEAWRRGPFEDHDLAERSPRIVVGHLQRGSLERIEHPDEGRIPTWEHHAILIVSEVLKGSVEDREIPIAIHYGLEPVVGGDASPCRPSATPDAISIVNTGDGSGPVIDDAGKDVLWFLRRLSGSYGEDVGRGPYGIRDPEDVQPLAWRRYFIAFLSKDQEANLRRFVRRHPDQAARAQSTLDHFEIERLKQIADPEARAEALIPLYLRQAGWYQGQEPRVALLTAGSAAGRRLVQIFDDPRVESRRWEIIQSWNYLGFREVAPLLIQLLLQRDRYVASLDLQKGWWIFGRTPEADSRRNIYEEIYHAVDTLRALHDPAAREALELTCARWKGIASSQIFEVCDQALHELESDDGATSQESDPPSVS